MSGQIGIDIVPQIVAKNHGSLFKIKNIQLYSNLN